ncbi:aromatic amino acid transporter (plasmid) [Vibrio tubiashii]|uniref:Aromatic amino acid permease n=1 Tax=Vibrio tubiashii TaxID=29498 RepID=A0AAE5GQF0_9VIBR|nr:MULTISPECIES: aromatic amino acid transporter [Vibrio oreintalis group]MCG9583594.1 aromatic amino acid transporter [Vibrio tubiashii]MCG9617171.1 aromatic amino acid transporter [Vibrio tubiashii]MCG9688278.1 aromatic amino acid transporter [Vibrio tubiashii]MCG9753261.1 aromatic amino acid transporter [Vibrio brasiliensis]MDC5822257.1 aromatic amino acid transporter [Vibrio europaeus]
METTSQSKHPSLIGGVCIIASICIGAGMLGLPTVGAGAWTLWSLFTMFVTMLVMTLSGCLILEVLQTYPYTSSFSTLTQDLLGTPMTWLNNIMVYFVGAILLYAYISSAGQLLHQYLDISVPYASIAFTALFSYVVWHSTFWVDRLSVLLMIIVIFTFAFSATQLAFHIDVDHVVGIVSWQQSQYIWALFPIAVASFGYHHAVSSMRDYYRNERMAQYSLIGGTSIAFLCYAIWLVCVYGNLPQAAFHAVIEQGGNIDALLEAVNQFIPHRYTTIFINSFSTAALLSSFVGVGLGVFDFLADMLHFDNSRRGRTKTWAATFLPPLLCSLLLPFGFVSAIALAAAAAAIWMCLIPALLVYKTRQKRHNPSPTYRVYGGNITLLIVFVFGLGIIVINLLSVFNALPVFWSKPFS